MLNIQIYSKNCLKLFKHYIYFTFKIKYTNIYPFCSKLSFYLNRIKRLQFVVWTPNICVFFQTSLLYFFYEQLLKHYQKLYFARLLIEKITHLISYITYIKYNAKFDLISMRNVFWWSRFFTLRSEYLLFEMID